MRSFFLFVLSLVSAQLSSGDGYQTSEAFYPNNLQIEVYTKTWLPLANVVFVHGHAEHINRYNHVFSEFAKAGIKVHSFDQVGAGQTGKRANNLGGCMGMERVHIDIDDAIVRTHDGQTPLILMGHSFGGETILDYLARGNRRSVLYGALASAPCLALAPESQPKENRVRMLVNVANRNPQFRINAKLDMSFLTRNQTFNELTRKDPYFNTRWAAVQLRDTVVGGRYVLDGGYRSIQVPRLMIVHGTDDKITSYNTSEQLAGILRSQGSPQNLVFKTFPGGYHELHNDIIKDEVIRNHVNWILAQVGRSN